MFEASTSWAWRAEQSASNPCGFYWLLHWCNKEKNIVAREGGGKKEKDVCCQELQSGKEELALRERAQL